ncbi:exopolysaccharide biosynthesis polyprenyl glycosylphosphotransferase [Myxosarcina sp. GI1]|uniref:exopolysaccharide biosynthesis polyprenyl glycosylphosphotransferase n=1 Tax=Myxosarcina sp. GI1 TaxID=1541065 RepID=UPI0005610EE5|nr:exopolysaccharide biosynthesis polyprenyl glycosylphosphotransferase [Myxosarcina sp. GI1]
MTDKTSKVEFSIVETQDIPVIKLPERLTLLEAVDFKQTVSEILTKLQSDRQLILDFSQTRFIDSSGIGALIANYKTAKTKDIELVLESVQPAVMATLSMTGLEEVLTIKSSATWTNRERPETHPSVRSWLKRAIDFVGSIVGLILTAIIFVPIAIAIKLDSPGKIFFRQTRCGWMGKKFKIWKFRSMYANAEEIKKSIENQASGAFFKNDNDPRITKVGRFLRRTSLDELPQFWNVFIGDMSLVGTRPPTPEEVEVYQVPEWQRLNVKPGMTGEWQVNGRSQVRNFEDVIELDLRYQRNWSLRYDIKLIFKTVAIVFAKNSGAV